MAIFSKTILRNNAVSYHSNPTAKMSLILRTNLETVRDRM